MLVKNMFELSGIVIVMGLCFCNGAPPLSIQEAEFGGSQEVFAVARLPVTIIPELYRLEIQPILDEGFGQLFTAPGKIWITGVANASSSFIQLNLVDIDVKQETVSITEDGSNTVLGIAQQIYNPDAQIYTISLTNSLTAGRTYTIYIQFTAQVKGEEGPGLYRSQYLADDGTTRYLASTDFEAPDARMAFPCFDEPQFKAEWDISIIRLPKYHTLSNSNLLRTETNVTESPGWVRDVYNRTVLMSTYLVCFAVSDFTSETANSSLYNRPVVIWGPPPLMAKGMGKFSPDFSAKIMTFFEEHYRIPYVMHKMDKISIPNFSSGAMENWGLNTYRETRLLYEVGVSTTQDWFSMMNTISHELVHQWFGNLITTKWWDDLWIQEGAATYYAPVGVAGVGYDNVYPMEHLITSTVQRSLDFDASDLTHPMSHKEELDPSNVPVIFDTLTYHKGGSLIRMMVSFLTPTVYRDAMTAFLNRFAFANANAQDMYAVIDKVVAQFPVQLLPVGQTVSGIMDGWTNQAGFPVVTVERSGDITTFSQSRFVRDLDRMPVDEQKWTAPISIFYPTDSRVDTRPVKWILESENSTSMVVRDRWFVINPHTSGYYRTLYKGQLIDSIIEQLHTDHMAFDAQTRSALVDDNLNLAFAKYQNLSTALNLTMYLSKEMEVFPWISFVTNMARPYRMFSRNSAFPAFKKYILGLVKPALEGISLEPQPSDSVPQIMLRTRLFEWACNHGDANCTAFAKARFTQWIANPANVSIIFPDLQPSTYCTAVANGGDAEWEFALEEYKRSTRETMQLNLLRALGCSKTSFRLNNLLDLALGQNTGIRANQRVIAMQAVAGNSAGTDIAFNFIRNNYQTIVRRYGTGAINGVLSTLANSYNDQFDYQDIERFINANSLSSSPLSVIQTNIDWMEGHYRNFNDFIQNLA